MEIIIIIIIIIITIILITDFSRVSSVWYSCKCNLIVLCNLVLDNDDPAEKTA